jgi:hypothetical protein
MKVKMKTRACGDINAEPGETIDVDASVAKSLIDGGFAEAEGGTPTKREVGDDGPEADSSTGSGDDAGDDGRGAGAPKPRRRQS